MRHNRLDGLSAEWLLAGHVEPDEAPQGYHQVAGLLAEAASLADVAETPGREAATVASMQAAVLGRPVPIPSGGPRPMRSKYLPAKIASAAAVVVLGGGTAAAAAGSLPGSVQTTAAHVLSSVGIDVPTGDNGPNPHSNGHANGHATGQDGSDSGTGPNSHALPGLCNAAAHNGGHPGKSTVFSSVATSTVCSTVPKPGQSGTSDDSTTEPSEPTGPGDDHEGPPTSTPASGTAPVATPDEGTSGSSTGSTDGGDHSTTTTVGDHVETGH